MKRQLSLAGVLAMLVVLGPSVPQARAYDPIEPGPPAYVCDDPWDCNPLPPPPPPAPPPPPPPPPPAPPPPAPPPPPPPPPPVPPPPPAPPPPPPPPPGPPPPPDADPTFYAGTEEDGSWYTQFCGWSTAGPLAPCLTQASPGTLPPRIVPSGGCATVGAWVEKRNPVTRIWRFVHSLTFCWNGAVVTSIRDRIAEGTILIPVYARPFYPWSWTIASDSTPTAGFAETRSRVTMRFSMCAVFRLGPLCITNEPWIDLTLYGSGAAICNTSAGRVRSCVFPR